LLCSHPRLQCKIRLAPLGIHPERAPQRPIGAKRPPAAALQLLSVGRLTETKGMRVALEALALAPREGWRWRVAGTGPELEALRQRAKRLGLDERVEFLGEVDDRRLAALYAQSDVFVYPELSYPAFGLVALEALLAGLPVVASDRGAIPEVARPDCAWLVPGGDPKALADCLKALVAHPERIAEKAARCRELALRRFPYEGMIEKTRAALKECAAG